MTLRDKEVADDVATWELYLARPWRTFSLGRTDGYPHLFYRCGYCGSVTDWRDDDLHLRHHGVRMAGLRAELVRRQEDFAGVRRPVEPS